MQIFKRCAAIVIILSLLVVPTIHAEKNIEYEENLKVLTSLGFFPDEDMRGETPSLSLTKAQFVAIVIDGVSPDRLIKLEQLDIVFKDVTPGHMFARQIYNAKALGMVSGYDNMFYPDSFISFNDAVVMLVKLLGYDNVAALRGGYPVGYISIAGGIGLLKNTNIGGNTLLNLENAVNLVYNILNKEVLRQVSFSGKISYDKDSSKIFMREFIGIDKTIGVLTSNEYTSISGENISGAGEVKIGSTILNIGNTNAADYIGYNVEAYYKILSDEKTPAITYIKKLSKNKELRLGTKRIVGFLDNTYSYYDESDKNILNEKIPKSADIIYNGKIVKESLGNYIPSNGFIVIIDSNDDGLCDVLKITDYKVSVVRNVVHATGEVISKFGMADKLTLDTSGNRIIVHNKNGDIMEHYNIGADDVISVAKSQDGKLIDIIVSRNKIVGKVDGLQKDENRISINGKWYEFISENVSVIPELGGSIKAYLDAEDKIAGYEIMGNTDLQVGYLIDAALETGIAKRSVYKIFSLNGTVEDIMGANKITVDDVPVSIHQNIINTIKANASSDDFQQLIGYRLNSEREICEIDLASTYTTDINIFVKGLQLTYNPKSKIYYNVAATNFENRVKVSPDTKIFVIPEEKEDYEMYKIESLGYLPNGGQCIISAYSLSEDTEYSQYVVVYTGGEAGAINHRAELMLVEQIGKALNDENEEVYAIKGIQKGAQATVLTRNTQVMDGLDIESGDLLRFSLNKKGEAVKVEKTFDLGTEKLAGSNPSRTSYVDYHRFVYGSVYKNINGLVYLTTKNISDLRNRNDLELIYANKFNQIYVFDRNLKRGYIATSSDVKDYLTSPNDYSKLFVYTLFGMPHTFIIYNK